MVVKTTIRERIIVLTSSRRGLITFNMLVIGVQETVQGIRACSMHGREIGRPALSIDLLTVNLSDQIRLADKLQKTLDPFHVIIIRYLTANDN